MNLWKLTGTQLSLFTTLHVFFLSVYVCFNCKIFAHTQQFYGKIKTSASRLYHLIYHFALFFISNMYLKFYSFRFYKIFQQQQIFLYHVLDTFLCHFFLTMILLIYCKIHSLYLPIFYLVCVLIHLKIFRESLIIIIPFLSFKV